MSKDVISIILAAGEGKRMKSQTPKVLHQMLGRPLLSWVIKAVGECVDAPPAVVVGHKKEAVMERFAGQCLFFVQEEQLGTGHAVLCCKDYLNRHSDSFCLLLSGDTPLITGQTLCQLIETCREGDYGAVVLTSRQENPTGYGRIVKDETGNLLSIVEERDADEATRAIKEVNSGIYCFKTSLLNSVLPGLSQNNSQKEYYLTDTIELLRKAGAKVGTYLCPDNTEVYGINDRGQLSIAEAIARKRVNNRLRSEGVTVRDDASTFISPDAMIGVDTEILPGCIIEEGCEIGEGCVIGPNTRLRKAVIGRDCTVNEAQCQECVIETGAQIGPFVHIRPNSHIGMNMRIGNFVEIKNSTLGAGTKVSHLTYVGDSDIGKNVNFGCGTVTVNYDGDGKYRTVVGNNVFIGCNTNLIAPVTVEKDSYIAAGSTITERVPQGNLAIARAKQVNKEGWVKKREGKNK